MLLLELLEEMQKAEQRGADLKAKLSAMLEALRLRNVFAYAKANESSEALQLEEENLRLQVAAKAQSQAKDMPFAGETAFFITCV